MMVFLSILLFAYVFGAVGFYVGAVLQAPYLALTALISMWLWPWLFARALWDERK